MPGISLLHGPSADERRLGELLDTVRFFDGYDRHSRRIGDRTAVGWTEYEGYPITRVETEDALVVLEGFLYGVDDVRAELREFADSVIRGEPAEVTSRLSRRDGDFLLLCVRSATGEAVLFNDTFGRLPTYRATVGDTVVVSRELTLVREFARRTGRPVELDRIAAAQNLVFGHPLGTRTTFDGVRSLPPGTCTGVDGDVTHDSYYRHDYGRHRHADKTVEQNADALASLFAAACRNRNVAGQPNLLSLSGGLDSRIVAGAYADLDIPFRAVSFDNERGVYEDDARTAGAVAEALDAEWTTYEARASEAHRETLLSTMQGMNGVRMSFIIDFFEQLASEYDVGTYVTGDGGDKVLVDLTPPRALDDTDDVVEYVLSSARRLPIEDAAAVVGIDPDVVRASVEDRIASYPETDPEDRYVRFLVRERGGNMLTQGEDRNRYYFWSATPFYSLPFFSYAMNCPPEQKSGRELYTAVLESFDAVLLDVEYPDYGAPITSMEYRLKSFVYGQLCKYPSLRRRVMKSLKGYDDGNREGAEMVRRQLSAESVAPLDEQAVDRVVRNRNSYRVYALNSLCTLASVAGDLEADGERPRPETVALSE
jgi:asparagine synthase (glutamine-hydrolysing)